MSGVLVKTILCGILVRVIIRQCHKACKFGGNNDVKNYSCKKRFFGKLVLACDNEILNKTEVVAKILNCATSVSNKNNHLIHTVLLVIICSLLLVVFSISCYYFYTKHCLKINAY